MPTMRLTLTDQSYDTLKELTEERFDEDFAYTIMEALKRLRYLQTLANEGYVRLILQNPETKEEVEVKWERKNSSK